MFSENEVFFFCPYCFESISMVFELLHGSQNYIEDCEVCCRAIEVKFKIQEDEVVIEDVRKAY